MSVHPHKVARVADEEGDDAGQDEAGEELQTAVDSLSVLQADLGDLSAESADEILAIEQKYSGLRRSVYEKRTEVINGIERFWLTVFQNHPGAESWLEDGDDDALQHCTALDVVENEDISTGYKILMTFAANPYFTNKVLWKAVQYTEGAPEYSSSGIDWHEGMDLTHQPEDDEPRGRKRGAGEANRSFFCWFTDNTEASDVQDLGDLIKEHLWPNPLDIYLGGFEEDGLLEEEGEEGEQGDGGDDDEGDEEEGEGQEGADDDDVVELPGDPAAADEDEDEEGA